MNNVIYVKTLLQVPEMNEREIGDGETSIRLFVTEEENGYAVWCVGPDGEEMLKHFWRREEAIEFGVEQSRALRKHLLETHPSKELTL